MDRITRKSLKDDRFAVEVTHSVEYLSQHRRQSIIYGGLALLVVALALGGYFYRQNRKTAAHRALYKALETYHSTVSQEETPGRISFRTDAEKNNKALQEFQALSSNFARYQEGRIASYYLGLVYNDLGNKAEAQKQLEQLIALGQDEVRALARLALAEIYLSQGKDEAAQKLYEYLLLNPADTVAQSRVQMAMARSLLTRKPAEARKLLEEMRKRPGPAAAMASNLLLELDKQ